MNICEACGGTFFPESLGDVVLYRSIRDEKGETPEVWHMTDALHKSLADFHPGAVGMRGEADPPILFGLSRCSRETPRRP